MTLNLNGKKLDLSKMTYVALKALEADLHKVQTSIALRLSQLRRQALTDFGIDPLDVAQAKAFTTRGVGTRQTMTSTAKTAKATRTVPPAAKPKRRMSEAMKQHLREVMTAKHAAKKRAQAPAETVEIDPTPAVQLPLDEKPRLVPPGTHV